MDTFHLNALERLVVETPWGPILLVAMPQGDGCLVGLSVPRGVRTVRREGRDKKKPEPSLN